MMPLVVALVLSLMPLFALASLPLQYRRPLPYFPSCILQLELLAQVVDQLESVCQPSVLRDETQCEAGEQHLVQETKK